MRIDAASALVERMVSDSDLDCIVRASFPDEAYDTFDAWLEAQSTDDTEQAVSELWHGGGQWLLMGLGLRLKMKIIVSNVSFGLELGTPPQTLIDATDDGAVAHLAMMHNEDGVPCHFDLLCDGPTEDAVEMRPTAASGTTFAAARAHALATTAMQVLILTVCIAYASHLSHVSGGVGWDALVQVGMAAQRAAPMHWLPPHFLPGWPESLCGPAGCEPLAEMPSLLPALLVER